MMMRFLCLILLGVLAACISPTAKAPTVMEQELAAEARKQQEFYNQEKLKKTQYSAEKNVSMEQRLVQVGSLIQKGGLKLCKYIAVDQTNCVYKIILKEEKSVNAYADGKDVYVTTAMMNFVRTDTELATILGHEYAHNMMGHVDAQQKNSLAGHLVGMTLDILASAGGVGTGSLFSNAGAQIGGLRYSQGFENEADYIGLYIMANSGFNIDNAPHIWRRFSIKDGEQAIYSASSHPTNPHRFIAMTKAIEEIKKKKSKGLPLIPEFMPQEDGAAAQLPK